MDFDVYLFSNPEGMLQLPTFRFSGCERSSHGTGTSEYHVHRYHHVRGERLQGAVENFESKNTMLRLEFIEFFSPPPLC